MKSAVISISVSFLLCLAVLLVGELAARAWIERYGDALDITRRILVVDSRLGWRVRPNLDVTFLGVPLRTNEVGWRSASLTALEEDTPRILLLGPSSAFGWGVRAEETYSALLEDELRREYPVEVVNAGQIGYSAYQGLLLFSSEGSANLEPDVVVIAYGVNDIDRRRFYFQSEKTDVEEFSTPKSQAQIFSMNALFSTSLGSMLARIFGAAALRLQEDADAYKNGTLRVPLKDFQEHIRALVGHARLLGARPIILTTAVHMPDLEEREAHREEIERIRRDVAAYNDVLRSIAQEESVALGDIEMWIGDADRDSLFVDPIHYSPEGHRRIARGLADILAGDTLSYARER